MPMIQRRRDRQRRIRILSRPAPEAPSPPPSRSPSVPPQARFAAPGKIDVLMKFQPQAFDDLLAHCAESNVHGREVCGLLLGVTKNQGERCFLAVTDILPFEASDASGAHVSANEDAWVWAEAQIEERFQGRERLGWYHTHPTQGIFFSGSDKDFHSIFTKPYQFALVVDPRFPEVGLFHWQDRQAGQIAGPIPLPLRTEPTRTTLPGPTLASHRLMLLVLTLAGFVVLLAVGPSRLLPLVFLFTAALFLRLWNASTVPGQTSQDREFRIGPAVATLLLGALLLPFLVAGVRLGTPLPGRWAILSQKIQAPPPTPTPTPAPKPRLQPTPAAPPPVVPKSPAPDPRQTPRTEAPARPIEIRPATASRPLRREVIVQDRSRQVTLFWRNGQAAYKADRKGRFQVDKRQETALLGYLLGVAKPGAEDFKLLQKAVGISDPDGSWGSISRSDFVRKVRKCAPPGCEIKISSKTQDITISFRRKG